MTESPGTLRFRPGLFTSVLALIFIPVFCLLGVWQLNRADEKAGLFETFTQLANETPMALSNQIEDAEQYRYRKLQATGRYIANRQFLRDNRTHNGFAGYHVLTPFLIEEAGIAVLVNRGWVRLGESRAVLPNIRVEDDRRTVVGLAHLPDRRTIVLGEEEPAGWPRVIQKIDFRAQEEMIGVPLVDIVLRLDDEQPDGYTRGWKPFYGIVPDKHRAYAMQWFSFAALALILYLSLNISRVKQD